ncbi:pimeloyl-ACP methyl ester carboxylesterase [Microbacterium sp. W4I4]|uniref:alpha/beta hydrolase n=1 Tax=Microbacterium sp. W4I4 TaxID=3042295 RepID=UPI0027870CD8|nr:alpha/beta hydrolase [Microbacterium sp. W4I4]MDQ0614826.1 pimeloyl-ACP methyl ester carboxylesterase [Microbacterium sp. W4I4]
MSSPMSAVERSIRLTGAVSPAIAGRLAHSAFLTTSPRMRVRADDLTTHRAARREVIDVQGNAVTTYQWGTGTRAALVMHGWNGRTSQFATLVRDLVGEGYRVVGFDAPAHGDSAGKRTDARDWISAARRLSASDGPFDIIVGHSFGAFAALAAVRAGVPTRGVVSIAGAGTGSALHDEFQRMLRLTPRVRAAFEKAFYRRLGLTRAESDALFDSLANPLPAGVELLVAHDENDMRIDAQNSRDLAAAHSGRSHLLLTRGFGHNRILAADPVLDAVLAFAAGGLSAVGDAAVDDRRERAEQR